MGHNSDLAHVAGGCSADSTSSSPAASSTFYSTASSPHDGSPAAPGSSLPYFDPLSQLSPSLTSSFDSTEENPPYSGGDSGGASASSFHSTEESPPYSGGDSGGASASTFHSTEESPPYSGGDSGGASTVVNNTPVRDANGDSSTLGASSIANATPDYNNPATYDSISG